MAIADIIASKRAAGCRLAMYEARFRAIMPQGIAAMSDPPSTIHDSAATASTGADLDLRVAGALQARAEVLEAYLFGSHATRRAQLHSDIDIAVFVDHRLAGDTAYGYAAELAAHLMGSLRTNEIDVVVLNRAPPVLYHRILRDGRRILARDLRATTTREGYALSRYCDYVPQLAKIEAARRSAAVRAP